MATVLGTDQAPVNGTVEPLLPELRAAWWETGLRARADAGILTVLAELPHFGDLYPDRVADS